MIARVLGGGPAAALRRTPILLILSFLCTLPFGVPALAQQEPGDDEWVDEEWGDEDQWDDGEDWADEGWDEGDWDDGELYLEEDLSGGGDLDPLIGETIKDYASRLYRNRDRGFEQMIEGLGYLRELSFNESMRPVEKDFYELFGEALGKLIMGGVGLDLPKVAGLKLGDLPSLIPLIEAWGEEMSPSRRTQTVGDWIQAQWDRLRLLKADLPDPDVLAAELETAYLALEDADARIDFEIWLEQALEAEDAYREPDPLLVEQRFWEKWINAHFDGGELSERTCRDAGGCLEIWFEIDEYLVGDPDFRVAAAEVVVPGAEVVTAGLKRIMERADRPDRGPRRRQVRLLGFAVSKRVCFGSFSDWNVEQPVVAGEYAVGDVVELGPPPCGWLGPDNQDLASPADAEIAALFANPTWRRAGGGGILGFVGWE